MRHIIVFLSCLILSFLSSCGNNEALLVIQSPSNITVKEGETAHMRCCWGGPTDMQQVRVEWHTSRGLIININRKYENRSKTGRYSCVDDVSGNCSNFSISSALRNDTGVFICNILVEIPTYIKSEGPGTQLTVERTNSSSTVAAKPMESIVLTSVLIPLAVVMAILCLCAFLCYWRKKKLMPYPGQASGKVGMIIHEVPHDEGEEMMEQECEMAMAENEGSSRSSHGSTQWCAVPVYESFDYFAVQTSKDG